ncbi:MULTISPECIES: hypothetical protein [Bradyrhizobium]|uniref:hypothetical protein n=1 Tax=Bradyrhizobium TaxID=374 RepID=UPI0023054228|nr:MULTISPECIES: hypothetical protein [unclassified Bradyrhizobium]
MQLVASVIEEDELPAQIGLVRQLYRRQRLDGCRQFGRVGRGQDLRLASARVARKMLRRDRDAGEQPVGDLLKIDPLDLPRLDLLTDRSNHGSGRADIAGEGRARHDREAGRQHKNVASELHGLPSSPADRCRTL